MNTSNDETGQDDPAEPVDAEFEPAPDGEAGEAAQASRKPAKSGAGWFKVSLFVIAAAAIGGGSGWLVGQVWQGPLSPQDESPATALAERIAALETAEAAVSRDDLDALQARIAALEEAQNASGLRADAVEQLVRDVADLRGRIEELEAQPEARPADAGAASDVDDSALAQLEARMAEAFDEVETRLQSVEGRAQSADQAAEDARSAAQQALDALADRGGEAARETPSVDEAVIADLRRTIARLSQRQEDLAADLEQIDTVSEQLNALRRTAVDAQALGGLERRVGEIDAALTRLEQDVRRADGQAETERSLADQALAFAVLSQAASGSEPFAAEFAELARVWPQAPQRAALAPVARTGAPTREALAEDFPAEAVRAASGETETYFGVLRVRREGEAGPAAAIQAALAAGDLSRAVALGQALQAEAGAPLDDWLERAGSRLTVDAALAAMADALSERREGVE